MPAPTLYLASGATLLALLIATPALALATADAGDQPAPGSRVAKTTSFAPSGQPAPGSRSEKTTDFVLGGQPANPDPDLSGPPTAVVDRSDTGVKGLPVSHDTGKKDLPVQRDHR